MSLDSPFGALSLDTAFPDEEAEAHDLGSEASCQSLLAMGGGKKKKKPVLVLDPADLEREMQWMAQAGAGQMAPESFALPEMPVVTDLSFLDDFEGEETCAPANWDAEPTVPVEPVALDWPEPDFAETAQEHALVIEPEPITPASMPDPADMIAQPWPEADAPDDFASFAEQVAAEPEPIPTALSDRPEPEAPRLAAAPPQQWAADPIEDTTEDAAAAHWADSWQPDDEPGPGTDAEGALPDPEPEPALPPFHRAPTNALRARIVHDQEPKPDRGGSLIAALVGAVQRWWYKLLG